MHDITRLTLTVALAAALAPAVLGAADTNLWTGPSAGVQIGLGKYDSSWTDKDYDWYGGTQIFSNTGLLAGANVGYDHQIGSLVVGAAFDWDRSSIKSDEYYANRVHISNELESMRSLRLRAGFAVETTLFYLTAGVAKGKFVHTWNENGDPPDSWASFSNDTTGRVLGVGLEHMVASKWSVKAELLNYTFGEVSSTNENGYTMLVKEQLFDARAGVSYRF